MTPYHEYTRAIAGQIEAGRKFPLGGFKRLKQKQPAKDAPRALIFAPHPDDECIIGGLPLRMMREGGFRVINVAVTQGSNRKRRAERWQELEQACDFIGFELIGTQPDGLNDVNSGTREANPELWNYNVDRIVQILRENQPHSIFFPHNRDWNSTHIGTHHLVVDALRKLNGELSCFCFETEFWGAMWDPNLMVETAPDELGDLLAALSFHVGEVKRNPYHLTVPAWMQDNVRRGGEVALGQGAAAPDFIFATLYRLRHWQNGKFDPVHEGGRTLASGESVKTLFA